MCKWGDLEEVNVTIPAELSSTGKEKKKSAKVDKCISGLVDALNRAGIKTRTSCCGHGKTLGHIILTDGRELFIAPSYPIGRVVDMFMKNVDTEMAKINYEKEKNNDSKHLKKTD